MAREIGGLWRRIPNREPTQGEWDAVAEQARLELEDWRDMHPGWDKPMPKRMTYCPNGHNAFLTDEPYPECAACGATMTEDNEPFYEVIEASYERIERNQ